MTPPLAKSLSYISKFINKLWDDPHNQGPVRRFLENDIIWTWATEGVDNDLALKQEYLNYAIVSVPSQARVKDVEWCD